jgi:LacI family transcriptional regulator
MPQASGRKKILYFPQWIDFEVERGIVEYALEAHWTLTGVADHGGYFGGVLRAGPIYDGIITLVRKPEPDLVRFLKESDAPAVDLINVVPELDLPRVLLDDHEIGLMGADHLVDKGFEHLAFVRAMTSRPTEDRAAAFDECVERRGRTVHRLDLVAGGMSVMQSVDGQERISWLATEFQRLPKPLGIMIQYDSVYRHVVEACASAGLRIPDDIAVVSVGNTRSVCELSEPTLTSIEHNQRRQGYEAAAVLGQLMDGAPPPADPVIVPPLQVVTRESTDIFAVRDQILRKALYFLRDNFRDPSISVSDVVEACGTSRRHLYATFERHWNRSIASTLAELRIAEAKRLLSSTTEKQYSVAVQSGFVSSSQLSKVFSKRVGMSPGAFRSQVIHDTS